jgi:broad specificity phosphatase PhoE
VTTILLARHGETDWNHEHRLQGWADPPLNDLGREQARALAESLDGRRFDAVYTSDLQRASETAAIVAGRLGIEPIPDAGLREVDLGSWSGRLRHEVEGLERPDGETREQLRERVVAALLRIAAAHPRGSLLVVSHGGSLRALEGVAGVPAPRPLANCETFKVEIENGQVVLLEAPPPEPPREPEADDAEALEQR